MYGNRSLMLLVVAISIVSVPAFGGTITFSELGLATGDSLTNQLASLGVIFGVTNGTATVGDNTSFTAPLGSNIGGNLSIVLSSQSSTAALNVWFVDPTNSAIPATADGTTIFVDLWDTNSMPSPRVTVNAYDLTDTFLGKYDLTSEWVNGAGAFTGSVARLEFVDNGGDGHVFDNLAFVLEGGGPPQEIPEPGTFALLGLGLVGLGLALRRRKIGS